MEEALEQCRRTLPREASKPCTKSTTEKHATANTDRWGKGGEKETHSHHPRSHIGRGPPKGGEGTHGEEENQRNQEEKRKTEKERQLMAESQRQRRNLEKISILHILEG